MSDVQSAYLRFAESHSFLEGADRDQLWVHYKLRTVSADAIQSSEGLWSWVIKVGAGFSSVLRPIWPGISLLGFIFRAHSCFSLLNSDICQRAVQGWSVREEEDEGSLYLVWEREQFRSGENAKPVSLACHVWIVMHPVRRPHDEITQLQQDKG